MSTLGAHRFALQALVAVVALLVLAPPATASHSPTDPHGVRVDAGQNRIHYLARDGEQNNLTVTETADSYVFTESGFGIPPVVDLGGGCTVDLAVTTCPKAGIDSIRVAVFDLNDTVSMNAAPPNGTIIDGGAGDDDLNGGPGDDVMFGRDGIDVVRGFEGNDTINTGRGGEDPFFERFQTVGGGPGYDTATYEDRPAAVFYDAALTPFARDFDTEACPTFGGCFEIHEESTEVVIGSEFNDELVGGIEGDVFVGLGGDDTICGGLGVDTVDYSDSPQGVNVTLDGVLATDARHILPLDVPGNFAEYRKARRDCRPVDAAGSATTGTRDCTPNDGIPGVEQDCVGEDIENILGSEFDDVLVGNAPDQYEGQGPRVEPHGINEIDGLGGNDRIDGGFGADALSGGSGTDTVTYASRAEPVSAAIDGAPNDGTVVADLRLGDYDPRLNQADSLDGDVENLIGTAHDDVLGGDGDANDIEGGEGNDFIDGGGGADTIKAEGGDDAVAGGAGNDLLLGGEGIDQLDGENDDDDVRAEGGGAVGAPEFVAGGRGADGLSGGPGHDVLDYSDATTSVAVTLDGRNDDGPAEGDNAAPDFEEVWGGIADDNLVGSDGSELLNGGDGDDDLTGGGGADALIGGPGEDLAAYAERSTPVAVDLAAGQADDGDALGGIEKVLGGSGDDTLLGDTQENVLLGGVGNDRLAGAEGNDTLVGAAGDDTLSGDVGNDTLFGSDGDDTLSGGTGNDDLKGEAGGDSMDGGAGSDRHTGGPGVDTLLYATRTAGVTVTLIGKDNNGERNEDDFIAHDVESLTTGSGGDTIDADDNLKGDIKCGAGADVVTVDPDDRVAGDCENVRVSALGTRCSASTASARMSRSGAVQVRVFCAVNAKGTLRLQSVARVRTGKRSARRVLKLGSKSFSLKAGQRKAITVKASKTARRYIQRKKRLSVRARISAKTQRATVRTSSVFTVKARR